jgi:hypothetical protein
MLPWTNVLLSPALSSKGGEGEERSAVSVNSKKWLGFLEEWEAFENGLAVISGKA